MAKIPQQQFINAIEHARETMKKQKATTADVFFGKQNVWYMRVIEDDYNYYELHHYGTLILKVVITNGEQLLQKVKVTSASDRDGINSLLNVLGIDQKVNIHGDIFYTY